MLLGNDFPGIVIYKYKNVLDLDILDSIYCSLLILLWKKGAKQTNK